MNRPRLTLLLLFGAFALLDTCYRYLDFVVRHSSAGRFFVILVEQATGVYGVFVLLPLVFWAADAHRAGRYAVTLLSFSVIHTTWNWGTRLVLFPLFGLGTYDYGAMPVRYLMEFPSDVIVFSISCFIRRQYLMWQRTRQLETALAEARMELLTRQLQPHFLFNALNTVSALMREDIGKADVVLTRLGDFLRATIDLRNATTIPLKQELELLNAYVAIMQARFENKLSFSSSCPAGLEEIPVPPLLLQPIVENAMNHGRDTATGVATISLDVAPRGGHLICRIQDSGPGPNSSASGFGLEAVRKRLESIYGDRARLTLEAHQGTLVTLDLPRC